MSKKNPKPPGQWNNNKWNCIASACLHNNRKAWRESEPRAYAAAQRNGWLDECCAHMDRLVKPAGYWTKERCIESAQPYATIIEWQKAGGGAYGAAAKNDWLEECCAHMKRHRKPRGYWTKERCIESAKPHAHRLQWAEAERGAYLVATEKGWLDECCAHMARAKMPTLTHDEYVAWLAENRPGVVALEFYDGGNKKTLHYCEYGHEWLVRPDSIKSGRGCPKCRNAQHDENIIYCWKVLEAPDDVPVALPGYHLVKFGITSQGSKRYYDRIKGTAGRNKMQHEVLVYQHTNKHEARTYEKWTHGLGVTPVMPERDGWTEFRLVSDAELRLVMDMLPSTKVMAPARRKGGNRQTFAPMTAKQLRKDVGFPFAKR